MISAEPSTSHSRSDFALVAQIASLFVTGCVVWAVLLSLDPLPITMGWVLALSLLAWFCCSAMFAGVYFLLAEPITAQTVRTLLRTSTIGVWFTPAAILLAEYSPVAMVAALIVVVGATRVLYSEWKLAQGGPEQPLPAPGVDRLFEDYAHPAPALLKQLAPN